MCSNERGDRLRMTVHAHRNWYERHVLPYLIDIACSLHPVRRQRRKLLPLAQGQVLEIGIGTGLNLEHYDRAKIKKVVGLDPGLEMLRLAQKRAAKIGVPVELVGLSAEQIPFEAGTFDTVVVTYSLCTIPDPVSALREMRRVLKPAGKLIFCEHGLAPDSSVRRWQDLLTPLWSRLAGGCRLNRDIPAMFKETGFRLANMETGYLPGPRSLTYNYWGTAEAV
ncbi:MAG: class I SAM-dependent methyltransferase [Thermodesulfobacteriota bacterium]